MPELEPGPVTEPHGRGDQEKRHHRDAERGAAGERVYRGFRVAAGQKGVAGEREDRDQVIQHRGEGGQEKAPVGVQDPRGERAHTVEDYLEREDPEEQDRELRPACRFSGRQRRRAGPVGRQEDYGLRKENSQNRE